MNIGSINKDRGDYAGALENYRTAENLGLELNSPVGVAKASRHLGNLYMDTGEFDSALDSLKEAIAIFKENNLNPSYCKCLEELAEVYAAIGDYKNAFETYREYMSVHRRIFDEDLNKKLAEMKAQLELEKKMDELKLLKSSNEELTKINARMNEQNKLLKLQSITDSLTGLYNQKTMYRRLDEEIQRAGRYGTPLGILMLDLDNFKRVNDAFGHQAGDKILERVAGIIMNTVRRTDISFRYGGEEFLVIMPSTALKNGVAVAERLRIGVENLGIESGTLVTASGGFKEWDGENSFDFLHSADSLLYKAKKNGRNRVEK